MEKLLRNQINALAIGLLVLALMVIIQFGMVIKLIKTNQELLQTYYEVVVNDF